MPTVDVAIATARTLPRADRDDQPLRDALAAAGVSARTVAWDDPAVEWGAFRACVIRSTWNYVQNYPAFLTWAERCAAQTNLWNPLPVIRWNTHKSYLLELAERGVPVVPTVLVRRGTQASDASLPSLIAGLRARDGAVVIKPAVSAGSFGTMRCDATTLDAGQAHLTQMLQTRDMLVQRYMPSVETHGERACVWIDGQITHAVRKGARFAGQAEDISGAVPVAMDEADVAGRVMALAPRPLLYGRIDLVRGDGGQPLLMELELVEPALFLDRSPPALQRLASAIAALV